MAIFQRISLLVRLNCEAIALARPLSSWACRWATLDGSCMTRQALDHAASIHYLSHADHSIPRGRKCTKPKGPATRPYADAMSGSGPVRSTPLGREDDRFRLLRTGWLILDQNSLPPFCNGFWIDPMALGERSQALLTILYCSSHGLCRCGVAV